LIEQVSDERTGHQTRAKQQDLFHFTFLLD